MKTIKIITPIFFVASALTAGFAQSEYDDMYFTGKDREKKEVKKEEVYAYNSDFSKKKKTTQTPYVNPTDSYSARNLNPEYVARTNSKEGQTSDEYFVSNYQYVNPTANNLNSFNNNLNSWHGNNMYNSAYFSPGINSWNSPYYNSYYDPYYSSYRNPSPWSDPYYRSGWSSSFSYFWGSSYNYGWGANAGYSYGNPYYNNAWCPSNGYNNYGYQPTVIIVNNDNYSPNYGKRSTRSSATTHVTTTSRDRNAYVADTKKGVYEGGRTTSTGRSSVSPSTGSTSQSAYYNRSWRRDAQNASNSSNYSNGSLFNTSNGTNSRSSYNNSGTNSRSSSSSMFNSGGNSSRNSFNTGNSSSGGSRSSSGSSSSGSSSSGSRSSRGNN